MKYNKLVRDKIPAVIVKDGKQCNWHYADKKEFKTRLFEKMCEELVEFSDNPSIEEAADIYEVFNAMLRAWSIPLKEVVTYAADKRDERGGFTAGIILTEVSDEKAI